MNISLESNTNSTCVLHISGIAKKSEFESAEKEMAQAIAAAGSIKLLVLLEDFGGWEKNDAWGDSDFFFSHGDNLDKIAIVGPSLW